MDLCVQKFLGRSNGLPSAAVKLTLLDKEKLIVAFLILSGYTLSFAIYRLVISRFV